MKKIFTLIILMGMCTFISAQNVLNVSGNVTHTNGDVAGGVFLSLFIETNDESFVAETNEDGFYEFAIDLGDNNTQGCFELFMIDCSLEPVLVSDCYNPGNTSFVIDFIYCENGSDECFALLFPEVQDSSLVLTILTFGIPDYTYEWSDGSNGETLTVPLDATGEYCVTVTDSEDCVTSACIDLTPPDPCFVNIYQEYDWNSSILYAEGYGQTDDLSYEWSTGETGQTINITESGEYCVTMTDGLGCESIDCGYFEVDTWIEDCFSYIYSDNDMNVPDVTLAVESFGVAPFTYVWSFGDSIISTSQSIVPDVVGVYCVEVTDAEGCISTSCYDYFVWADCGVWVGCDPIDSGIQLWAFGYGAEPIQYIWSNGDEGQELIVTESGEYCVTITDANDCTSTACLNVNVEDVPECFTPIIIHQFEEYAELSIEPITDGEYEITWSNGESGEMITVQETGTYCVEVFEVATGCFFTTCATVYIGDQEDCWGWAEAEYINDSTSLLSVFIVDIPNDSTSYTYAWSTGELIETIEVTVEGEYCVTVTSSEGCVIESCIEVIFWDFPWPNSIWGAVTDIETGEALIATIDLYSLLDDGTLELYAPDVETAEDGSFFIDDVDYGNYIALATPDDEDYVPTYGYSTTSWELADVYQVGDNTAFLPLLIAMIPITNVSGFGSIEGGVSSQNFVANGKESDTREEGPVADANVMLMHNDIPVGQVFTNEEGYFKFSNLPYGTYTVVLEIPGHAQKSIEVTISEDNPSITNIEFETEGPSNTENISALSSLTLSPNPTSNTLVVETFFKEAMDLNYKIVDMNGRIISSTAYRVVAGENVLPLDVTSLQNGVYHIVLQSEDKWTTKRFVKI